MEGRSQLPASQVQEGCKIASLHIHVERAIGRIKNFKRNYSNKHGTTCESNCMCVLCAFLSNLRPALVPPPLLSESDVEDYLNALSDSDDDPESSDSE